MTASILRVGAYCAILALLSVPAKGQDVQQALARGTIVDQLHSPVAQAEVFIRDSMRNVVATTQTDSDGMFVLRGLAHNTQYLFVVRKIGLRPTYGKLWTPQASAGDTLWVDFELGGLISNTVRLDTVHTTAKANTSVFAKFDRLFNKIDRTLYTIDKILNKYCPKDPHALGLHLCIIP